MSAKFDLTTTVTTSAKNAHDQQVSDLPMTEPRKYLRGSTFDLHL